MKRKRTSSSGSESSDDVPLTQLKCNGISNSVSNVNKVDLFQYSLEKCEFCDRVCFNRYNILKHTATHIIIPLMRQKVLQCSDCLYYFTSQENLLEHSADKHKKITIINTVREKTPEYITSDIKEEPVSPKTQRESLLSELIIKDDDDVAMLNNGNDSNTNIDGGRIINRIVFEDDDFEEDIETNGVLSDLTTDCKVNLEMFNPQWLFDNNECDSGQGIEIFDGDDSKIDVKDDFGNGDCDFVKSTDISLYKQLEQHISVSIQNGFTKTESTVTESILAPEQPQVVDITPSIHFNDLVETDVVKCKRCNNIYMNRFDLIVHETTHMQIKKSNLVLCAICDRYIAGNHMSLEKHKRIMHSECELEHHRYHMPKHCKICNLKYVHYYQHDMIYHKIYVCRICGYRFPKESSRNVHTEAHFDEAKCTKCKLVSTKNEIEKHSTGCNKESLLVCKLCLDIFIKYNIRLVCHGVIDNVEKRICCKVCGFRSNLLNIVQRVIHSVTKCVHINKVSCKKSRKKPLSNEERLKNIQQRLKMLKLKYK